MLTRKIANLATRSVRYFDVGSGRPMLLLHAFPLSADHWLPQLTRVAPGWRAIAPDLRGFRGVGPAFGLPDEPISMDTYAADALELLAHLGVERAAVAGLSMGGYVAMALARMAPQRLDALVLADTRATADTLEGRAGRDRMIDLAQREGAAAIAREMVPKLLGETTRRHQPDLAHVIQHVIELNPPSAIVAGLQAMKARPDSHDVLAALTCPATIICGDEDTITPVADSEAMHRTIPGSKLVVLPRAGHLSNLEAPDAFTTALFQVAPAPSERATRA